MATRALSELIDEVRFNSNTTDDSRFDDSRLIKFFNSAQRQIQKIIYTASTENSPFAKEKAYVISTDVEAYALPDDIFAISAVNDVTPLTFSGSRLKSLRQITVKERDKEYGYFILNNSFLLAPKSLTSSFTQVVMTYTYALPDLETVSDEFPLPRAVEDFLMAFVERKIRYVDSSRDVMDAQLFTQEEKGEIIAVFQNISKDVKYPVIVNETYVNY